MVDSQGPQSIGKRRAKWVNQEVMSYRKAMNLCLRCGNLGHYAENCTFLPPHQPYQPGTEPIEAPQSTCNRRSKWVGQKVMGYRKEMNLCLRCGNLGHWVASCKFLPPEQPKITTNEVMTNAGMKAPTGKRRAKWVNQVVMKYRTEMNLCSRCGNSGHRAVNCTFLPPYRPGTEPINSNSAQESEVTVSNRQAKEEWRKFAPNMECPLFHTTAILNDVTPITALIDNGSQSYAIVNKRLADRLRLPLVETEPRQITGVLEGPSQEINRATYFSLDIGGFKTHRAFAYVLEGQSEDLIIGRPWLKHNDAVIDEKHATITFGNYDVEVLSNEHLVKDATKSFPLKISQILASTYAGLAQRQRRNQGSLQLFAASLADIEKALKPKPKITRAEVLEQLPDHYAQWINVFDPGEAAKLPPSRPGIDQEITIDKDDNGREKDVPWGPLYSMSRDELLVLRKELTSLLDKDFIRASKSPAGAPVLFAKKPGGGLRFCIDYRGLNAITRKDRYPLPLIRETLAALSRAKWLTKLDVSAAFHRIRIAKGDEWKTAFRTRYGLYEWKVCPFGLTNSPATFQRYINWALREYLDDFCSAYVDDILIFSAGSLQDHRTKVKSVLQRLDECGLQLDIKKCEFETQATKYLGYVIDIGNGIRMDPDKLKAIHEWQAPQTVKGVRSFLGFANYYRLFIKGYADVVKPLTDLTKKDIKFEWTDKTEDAFQRLKKLFSQEPILANYDPDRETQLEPDASGWAVGGVLTQLDTALQTWRPVAYFSTRHSEAECNYDIHDKELLAIVKCVKEWNSELRGLSKPFTVLTDHKNLEPFTTKRLLNERQVRWSEFLSPFDFKLCHRAGKEAIVPDALSRREQDVPKDADDSRIAERKKTILPKDLWVNQTELHETTPFTDDQELAGLWQQAMQDEEAGKAYLEAQEAVLNTERHFPRHLGLHLATGECKVKHGCLYYRDRLWFPGYEPLTTRVIQKIHDSYLGGHPGRDSQIAILARQFFWPGINQHVRRFIKNCDVCGNSTIWRDKKKGLLKPLPIPNRLWAEISIDFVTDLPKATKTGSTIMCVITDRFGKGTMLLPVKPGQFDAEGFADLFLERYIPTHWVPRAITSDRGVQFVNAFWTKLCELLHIERRLSTAYHPETDGSTERRNQEVETYLRSFVSYSQSNWDTLISMAQIALDNKPTSTTGVSPFFLSHGYEAEMVQLQEHEEDTGSNNSNPRQRAQFTVQKLLDARNFAEAALAAAQQQQEYYANQHREVPKSFQLGDKVWLNLKNIRTLRPSKKLDWIHAKYTITKIFPESPHFYELDVPTGIHNRFHISLLRPCKGTSP